MIYKKIPELLAPAGSPEALHAAVSAGADAVYMGLSGFNARANASNFGHEEFRDAAKLCRLYNRKMYITLNTLAFDREIDEVISEAYFCACEGVDAFIVQDFGLIKVLRKTIPEIPIHSSTQCATHNLEQIKTLASLGVSRAVVARELSRGDLEEIMRKTPIEIEAFVHGALCMSHSGTCLMSAYMGGRSGNRGECAQPCRLPYRMGDDAESYPLSLRDLSLCTHVEELCKIGIDSFKIEGRMKSAEYVYGVVSVWRRLLDERRNATDVEVCELESIFSRGGFTDGYYTLKKGKEMFGVRSQEDKKKTRDIEKTTDITLPKIPVSVSFEKTDSFAHLTLCGGGRTASVELEAITAEGEGTSEEVIRDAVTKFGGTCFEAGEANVKLDAPAFFRRSTLNAARREAASLLEEAIAGSLSDIPRRDIEKPNGSRFEYSGLWVVFATDRPVSAQEIEKLIKMGIKRVFLPFGTDIPCPSGFCGTVLPKAVFEKDRETFEKALDKAFELGYRDAYADNLGVAMMAYKKGFRIYGGQGLNVLNSHTSNVLRELGFEALTVSPEMTDASRRGFESPIPSGEVVWGRAPLMLVENCIMGVRGKCIDCGKLPCKKRGMLRDRTGESFPVIPDSFHRAVIYNSRPTYRADLKRSDSISFGVIVITDEVDVIGTAERVISKKAPDFKFTRK